MTDLINNANNVPNPFDPAVAAAGPILCRHGRRKEAPDHRAGAQAEPSGLRAGPSRSGVQTNAGRHYRGEGRSRGLPRARRAWRSNSLANSAW